MERWVSFEVPLYGHFALNLVLLLRQGFEYALDLHYNWSYGSANPTGRAQGIGWGQELVTRIKVANFTGPITSQNLTVDQDKNLFPTDQRFYFDFSHDSSMISVLTALNFTQFNAELDSEQIDKKRNFVLSHIAPFAARLFFEVCSLNYKKSYSFY